jgi:hypothetical protein
MIRVQLTGVIPIAGDTSAIRYGLKSSVCLDFEFLLGELLPGALALATSVENGSTMAATWERLHCFAGIVQERLAVIRRGHLGEDLGIMFVL